MNVKTTVHFILTTGFKFLSVKVQTLIYFCSSKYCTYVPYVPFSSTNYVILHRQNRPSPPSPKYC
jgi:hypothetical protein